jgi:Domain of unknown function (DUF4844)
MRIVGVLVALLIASTGWLYYKAFVYDEPLSITENTALQLRSLRQQAKFTDLPGKDTEAERGRNEDNLNELLDRIIVGISANPSKRWVILQMSPTVDKMYLEDTEARERFIDYLVQINKIVGISSTNGAFASKLIFF